ncbi:MAG: DUF1365 domain-containing protein [Bdellovibrionales bacterium]|nr:DUF1365 domain-containing protein [Bdellovibrionales bacterium]
MKTSLVIGQVWHRRNSPELHEFVYNHMWVALDLADEESSTLNSRIFSLGRAQFSLFTIRSRDYLEQNSQKTIREKVLEKLRIYAPDFTPTKIVLLTTPRLLGYVFNPVSIYLCKGPGGETQVILYEVQNTFGERHLYLAQGTSEPDGSGETRFAPFEKVFFVSPFLQASGSYEVEYRESSSQLSLVVNVRQGEELRIQTAINARISEFSGALLLGQGLPSLLSGWFTMPRILWQALWLARKRKIPLFPFDRSKHPDTIVSSQKSFFVKVRLFLLRQVRGLRRVER